VLLLKKYIPLPIYNSDDVVMSRENQNFHLRLFVKGGALHSEWFFLYIEFPLRNKYLVSFKFRI
jgi:hypothetical protein